jgi:hypothetical protein
MMYEKHTRYDMPRTVDEAAELLISDLQLTDQYAISGMDREAFDRLYESVAPFLIDEFNIWSGNDALLDSCLAEAASAIAQYDPAWVILNRVREILDVPEGLIIIT